MHHFEVLTFAKSSAAAVSTTAFDPVQLLKLALGFETICAVMQKQEDDVRAMVSSGQLCPSLFIDYWGDTQLGFFNFWDCISALLVDEVIKRGFGETTARNLSDTITNGFFLDVEDCGIWSISDEESCKRVLPEMLAELCHLAQPENLDFSRLVPAIAISLTSAYDRLLHNSTPAAPFSSPFAVSSQSLQRA